MQFEQWHPVGPESMAQGRGGMAIVGLGIDARSAHRNYIGQRIEIDRQRRAAAFASIAMDLVGTVEGVQLAALGPSKTRFGKNRERNESGALKPPADGAMAMMGFHRGLRNRELIRAAEAGALYFIKVCHDAHLLGKVLL